MERTSFPKEIQLFFNEVIADIKISLNPDFIIVSGSFGKESWLYANNKLISDFELVFICQKRWSLKKKKLLLKRLNEKYPYEISLKGHLKKNVEKKIVSNYSINNQGYLSLDFFDTFYDPKVLYAKGFKNFNLSCSSIEIPSWEAWRLYVNRMGDLLELEINQNLSKQTINYYWLKIFESTADAYCIINNCYSKNIAERLEIFNKELIERDSDLTKYCKNSFPLIQKALYARFNHNLLLFETKIGFKELKLIINYWMIYFEKKLGIQEGIPYFNKNDFYNRYLNSSLQEKYFGYNYKYNILISNMLSLLSNPNLINKKFNYLNHSVSWRHIILIVICYSFYIENFKTTNNTSFLKEVLSKIISKQEIERLSKTEELALVLDYWKILR